MKYVNEEINETIKLIEDTIVNIENVQVKLKEGTPQFSLSRNRLKVLNISKSLLMKEDFKYSKDELEDAIKQISSIKSKSMTGISHAKEGSSTYTRFNKLIKAMDIILDYLKEEI